MPPMTTTGDISYRTAGYFSKQLLERSQPLLVLDKFGQPKPLPAHSTRTIKFRGYEHLPNQPKALIEGVTPQASKPTFKDIEATINQYGDWIELTDVLADTHEDPLISEFSDILGEQAAIMRERITAGDPYAQASACHAHHLVRQRVPELQDRERAAFVCRHLPYRLRGGHPRDARLPRREGLRRGL